MKIKYLVYLLLLASIAAFIIYRIFENKSATSGAVKNLPVKGSPVSVQGVVIHPQSFANTLMVSGSIEANEQVDIHCEVSGVVESIYFEEGASIKKGQILLKVNDTELQAQLTQAQTQQQLAAENERRAGLLLDKEAISQEEHDVAAADLKSAAAQSQLILAQISKTVLKAPFDGTIGLRSISPGSYITPTTIIARLVNTQLLKITFSIPEKYSGEVKNNTSITFSVAGTNKKYTAAVYAIEPSIETDTRTLKLRALAKNTDGELLPGSFANIEVPLTTLDSALLVPTEAVIPIQEGKKVFVSFNGKAKEVKVETGTRTDKEILITNGLHAGDTVLTTGIMTLKNGTPLKVDLTSKESNAL